MEKTKEILKKIKECLQSKEMLCAAYAYDNEKNKNETSYQEFLELWQSFQNEEKEIVVTYFTNFNNQEMFYAFWKDDKIKRSKAYDILKEYFLFRLSNKKEFIKKQK